VTEALRQAVESSRERRQRALADLQEVAEGAVVIRSLLTSVMM
jgi:hypothetical protein